MTRCEACGDDASGQGHRGSDGLIRCDACQRIRKRELSRQRGVRFVAARPERRRSHVYKNKYGIDHDEFLRLLEAQDNLCAICREPETARDNNGNVRNLSVDHNHSTGRVRGLLCHHCNTALGGLCEDVLLMLSMIEYVLGRVA